MPMPHRHFHIFNDDEGWETCLSWRAPDACPMDGMGYITDPSRTGPQNVDLPEMAATHTEGGPA